MCVFPVSRPYLGLELVEILYLVPESLLHAGTHYHSILGMLQLENIHLNENNK